MRFTSLSGDADSTRLTGTPFGLPEIVRAQRRLAGHVIATPVVECVSTSVGDALGDDTNVVLKLELLQRAGSFKVRAAFLHAFAMTEAQKSRGVVAVSAGNHAIAVAYVAQKMGFSAQLAMFKSANPLRVDLCRRYGAEVILAETPQLAFDLGARIAEREARTLIHPFEGELTALGTATVGLELTQQTEPLDAVIVPVGGGGLAAGIATAIRQRWPKCEVFGVEPTGAASMHRSFQVGTPSAIESIETIADSLGPHTAMPVTFAMCRHHLASVELVTDDELRRAMRIMQTDCKIAVEPAGAAALAGLLGPLRDRLRGRRIGLIVCGTNIDTASYVGLLSDQ